MITKNATRIARERKVTYSWDGPAIEDAKDPGWNTRIDLVIEHDKNAKCYTATVYKLAARRDPRGYTTTMFSVFGSPAARFMKKPAGRFSENGLVLFESEVLNECDRLTAGPGFGGLAGLLLCEADGWAPAAAAI